MSTMKEIKLVNLSLGKIYARINAERKLGRSSNELVRTYCELLEYKKKLIKKLLICGYSDISVFGQINDVNSMISKKR